MAVGRHPHESGRAVAELIQLGRDDGHARKELVLQKGERKNKNSFSLQWTGQELVVQRTVTRLK